MVSANKCVECGRIVHIGDYPFCPHGRMHHGPTPGGNTQENAVVYVSAQEGGKIQYPGRADVPVPERLRKRGYVKRIITPQEMGRFEKENHVVNERRHFDSNGRGLDE